MYEELHRPYNIFRKDILVNPILQMKKLRFRMLGDLAKVNQ